jgi:hypothetical protein
MKKLLLAGMTLIVLSGASLTSFAQSPTPKQLTDGNILTFKKSPTEKNFLRCCGDTCKKMFPKIQEFATQEGYAFEKASPHPIPCQK